MRKLFSKDFFVSLEDTMISITTQEKEIAIYCKLKNKDGLKEAASTERHYQYMGSFTDGDKCRIRETITSKGDKSFLFTVKTKAEESDQFDSNIETSITVDEHFADVFKNSAKLHVHKNRYVFHGDAVKLSFKENDQVREIKLPDIKYEVDVFETKDRSESEWVKIDIELTTVLDFISKNHPDLDKINLTVKISHLPIEPTDAIIDFTATEENKAFIDKLWQQVYNVK